MESRAGLAVVVAAVALSLSGCSAGPGPGEPTAAAPAQAEAYELTVAGETASGVIGVPSQAPATLVVLAHSWGSSSEEYAGEVATLASAGVLAVAMDFRGAPEEFKVQAGVEDTVAATLSLQQAFPSIDRTLLYGFSMGGEVALLAAATAPPGTYDYVFSGAGVNDLASLWNSFLYARPFVERETGGTPSEVPAEYAVRSPVDRVADLVGKGVSRYFVVHGAGDAPVPVEQAERLYDAMAKAGLPVSYYVVTKNRDSWLCTPVLCAGSAPQGLANHEAGQLRLMRPFIENRIDRLPDPPQQAVRGTYDGDTGVYDPGDVG